MAGSVLHTARSACDQALSSSLSAVTYAQLARSRSRSRRRDSRRRMSRLRRLWYSRCAAMRSRELALELRKDVVALARCDALVAADGAARVVLGGLQRAGDVHGVQAAGQLGVGWSASA